MKKTFTLLSALTLTWAASAQITVDSSDVGSIGDQIIIVSDTGVVGKSVSAASNTAQTFDYTNMNVATGGTISFLDPAGSVGAANFPNANLMIQAGADFIYAVKSIGSFDMDGIYGDPLGAGVYGPVDFSPNVTMMQFPSTYNSTYTTSRIVDTVIFDTVTSIFDSLRLKSTTLISSTVDAFGTLNLPTTSAAVLRKYDMEVTNDTVWGLVLGFWTVVQNTSVTRYYYRFMANNKSYFMLEVEADDLGNVLTADFQTNGVLIAGITNMNPVQCYGESNGLAEVGTIGGIPPYSYAWSNGATTAINSGLAMGSYSVTVTDANSDSYVAQVFVPQPDSMDITSTLLGADHGLDDGFVKINVTGGTPSYSYTWSNGETTKNISGLAFGTYTVTVLDNNGCTNSNSFIVDDVTGIADVSSVNIKIYPNPSTGFVTIQSAESWTLSVVDLTGKQVATSFGAGAQQVDLSQLKSGMYFLHLNVKGKIYQSKLQIVE